MFRPANNRVPYDIAVKAQNTMIDDALIKNAAVMFISPEIDEMGNAFIAIGVLNHSVQVPASLRYTDESGITYNVEVKKEITSRIMACTL